MITRSSISRAKCAFSMVETTMAVVIVSVLLAAVVQTVGAANLGQFKLSERQRARQLGNSLLSEITALKYCETNGVWTLGPESGETRPTYDDVDDYNGLIETPPVNKDGSALNLSQASTWKRTVIVAFVDPTTLGTPASSADTGVKQITVAVYHNNALVLKVSAFRANNL